MGYYVQFKRDPDAPVETRYHLSGRKEVYFTAVETAMPVARKLVREGIRDVSVIDANTQAPVWYHYYGQEHTP